MHETHDPMTGVLRREVLRRKLEEMFARSSEEDSLISLAFLDLDNFKAFNDEQGHEMGDELIKTFASILEKNCRSQDLLGRYGGEEFLVVMPDTQPEDALLLMEDVRRQVSSSTFTLRCGDREMRHSFTFSGGIAAFPRDGQEPSEVVRAADSALYNAKMYGRDRLLLAVKSKMVLKSSYYPGPQLQKLADLAAKTQKSEAFLLREALDDLLARYSERRVSPENL